MAKRIAASAVNWAAIGERVPVSQKASFIAFKTKSDKYLRSVLANPEAAPKIDWTVYKASVPVAGMVDTFQKQYEALKVPYPVDNVSSQIDAQEKEVKNEITNFVSGSKNRISTYESQIAHFKSLLPYEQMTMEDFRDAFPETALDPINRPTLWPHGVEDQVGYESAEQKAARAEGHH